MVSGTVRYVEGTGFIAVVTVRVNGFYGKSVEHEAIIDTGFSGSVSLLPEDVATLGLAPKATVESTLADGFTKIVSTYTVVVEWDGIPMLADVIADDDEPLIGMELLAGCNLSVDVTDGGKVEITRLVPLRVSVTEADTTG